MREENNKQEIASSHQNCVNLGLKKEQVYSKRIITGTQLQKKIAENRKLILTAAPYIEHLINLVKGCNFFALLTDGEGCILNANGDEKILSEAFDLKMVPGAFMNEQSIGTNAMSIVMNTCQPVQISGKDHFINAYHKWTCSAAPIKDSKGSLVGVLNLTGYTEQVHPHTLGMVIAASNAIEEMAKTKEFNKLENMSSKHIVTVFNTMAMAIVTSDVKGKIKIHNNKALELFGDTKNKLEGKDMNSLIEDWDKVKHEICAKQSISKEINIKTLRSKFSFHLIGNAIYNPVDDDIEIVHVLEEVRKVQKKNGYQAYYTFDKIIGADPNFLKIVQYARKIADSKSTILILGESGTGKEVFAQSIHNFSNRVDGPFIALNCGAIPNQLMESELFGYDEGSFTGAKKGGSFGKFELANGGTILLDEIGEMPLDMQTKLLRVLQEGVVTKIGSSKSISVDVRVISATNKDLKKEVEMGRFRKDLYYRLNVLPLFLPPLRQRKGDILLLIKYFMENISQKLNKREVKIPEECLKEMIQYSWPGNIRELENVIELIVNTESVPSNYFGKEEKSNDTSNIEKECLYMEHIEKEHIEKVLKIFKANITRSAEALGIRRNTLYSKIKKYGIKL